MSEHELMTIEEVAKMLRVSERTVYGWAQKKEIPGGKFGTTWRFKRSEVTKWIDNRLNSGTQTALTEILTLGTVLSPERVIFLDDCSKESALRKLVDLLSEDDRIENKDELLKAIFKREDLMSTGIGLGIGVPHVRINSVKDIVMAVGVCREPITDYESLDGEPVRIICMIAAREDQHAKHIKLLSAVSKRLKNSEVIDKIIAAESPQAVFEILTGANNA